MKRKIITQILALAVIVMGFSSCGDLIEEYYINPNKTTDGNVAMLFANMENNGYVRQTYGKYATFVTGVTAKYTQLIQMSASANMYTPSQSYNYSRWNGFYASNIMGSYRTMEKVYAEVESGQKPLYEVFMKMGKVILYAQGCLMADYWGDIPFSEAGSLDRYNTIVYPKYDKAEDIYADAIEELVELNTYFDTVSLSSSAQDLTATYDIWMQGDISRWQKFTNSLRLRLLMRMSNYDETTAQAAVTAMLSNPTTYPMVDDNSENILFPMNPDELCSSLRTGLTDGAVSEGAIPSYRLLNEIMLDNEDPRVPVYWDPNVDGEYRGAKHDLTESELSSLWSNDYISKFDSLTIINNWNCPGILMTASEVSFFKAEANVRWGIGDDAADEYEEAIRQSIDFYYSLNEDAIEDESQTFTRDPETEPTETEICAFLTNLDFASATTEGKLEQIHTQKYVHFFILQSGQAWAELRRTGYPEITFAADPTYGYMPPERLLYPDEEKGYNVNYPDVKDEDTRDTKIFWDVLDD